MFAAIRDSHGHGRLLLSIGLACAAGVAHAQAGPPMITDDPGVPGAGNWEVNIAVTGRRGASVLEGEAPLLDINYGLGDSIQLKYEAPWVVQREDGQGSRSGAGNSMIGVKWLFHPGGEDGWAISTYPQWEFQNPGSHSTRRGLAEEGASFFLPIEFERNWGSVVLGIEVGHAFRTAGEDGWAAGIVLGREVGQGVELMVELHGESDSSPSRNEIALDLGGRFALSPRLSLLASVGRDLHNSLGERASAFGYLALQVRTPE